YADRSWRHGCRRRLPDWRAAWPTRSYRNPPLTVASNAYGCRGIHGADWRAAVPDRALGNYGVLALIMLMYLVLGCLMDAMAMIILTVPIIFPVITHLGFDPIWFGVIIVMTVELDLIHPPVGMNVFVIKSVVKDASFATIFRGSFHSL